MGEQLLCYSVFDVQTLQAGVSKVVGVEAVTREGGGVSEMTGTQGARVHKGGDRGDGGGRSGGLEMFQVIKL